MKKKPPAKPPEPTPADSSASKVPKAKKLEIRGQQITELAQDYESLSASARNKMADVLVRKGVKPTPEFLTDLLEAARPDGEKFLLALVRGFVEDDQTYPVSAKYLGRALKDMNAVGEPKKAKNRVEIMAFFHMGFASSIIRAPKGTERDYRETAKWCHSHREGAVERNVESDNASKGLEKPILILEKLNLALPRLAKTKGIEAGKEKRDGSYLTAFGGVVFNGWPRWPREPSSSPAP